MMRLVKRVLRRILNKARTVKRSLIISYYCHYYYRGSVKANRMLVYSRNGIGCSANLLGLLQELQQGSYPVKSAVLAVDPAWVKRTKTLLAGSGVNKVAVVSTRSFGFYKQLATVQYLFTDDVLPARYIKKQGQTVVNTWHGTPLKKQGQDDAVNRYKMGNRQRNILFADYLVCNSEFTKETLLRAFNADTSFAGRLLLEGAPGNRILMESPCVGKADKKEEVYAYLPTWEDVGDEQGLERYINQLKQTLSALDRRLTDRQRILVHWHPAMQEPVGLTNYKHLSLFPKDRETYQVLAECDGLITDYSSAMFDFAHTGKKIVLFTPEITLRSEVRGTYVPLDELPFPRAKTPEELVAALQMAPSYDKDRLLSQYATYDRPDAARRILSHVLKGEDCCVEAQTQPDTKPRVLLYCGALLQNGLTTAFRNLLNLMDLEEREYFYGYRESAFLHQPERLGILNDRLKLYCIGGTIEPTFAEVLALDLYYKHNRKGKLVMHFVNRAFKRDFATHFSHLPMDYVVNFSGYDNYIIKLLQQFDANKTIFVHSDMEQEMAARGNIHRLTLESAYSSVDHVAVVTDPMAKAVKHISGRDDNIVTVGNSFDYKTVQANGKKSIEYQNESRASVRHPGGIEGFLQQKGTKFITMGRYSVEKQHTMLIDAFDEYWREEPNSYLIIIGGGGKLYDKTVKYANSKESGSHIACLWSLQNPMPIVKQCDLFVLPSMYEALGLVMFEAVALDVPVFCTEMDGPRAMMKEYGGTMVPNSMEGVLQGFRMFRDGKIPPMHIDFDEYNKIALEQFENLFE